MHELFILLNPQDHKEKQTNSSLNYYKKIKWEIDNKGNIIKVT